MRVMIDDMWLRRGAPARVKRAISEARDPMKARVPQEWRAARFGRGMRWRCRWFQPAGGGLKARTRRFAKRADAESFAAAMEDDVRRGRYHDPSQERRLFADVAGEWIKSKVNLRPGTAGRYRKELRLYILPTFGMAPIGSITRRDVQAFTEQLQNGSYRQSKTATRKARPLSARSIRNIVSIVLGGVLQYAHEQGWIVSNPEHGVTLPRIMRPALTIPTLQQVEQIASTAGQMFRPQDRLIVLWQAYTGMRIGETLALKTSDIDFDRGIAHIRRAWQSTGTGRHILGMPKNGKPRDIAVPRFLLKSVQRKPSGWLFTAPRGGPIYEETWRTRVWYPALKACKLYGSGITVHSLRHAYASMAIAAGADVKTLQRQLGHSSAKITLDVYASLWPNRLSDVANAVEREHNRVTVG